MVVSEPLNGTHVGHTETKDLMKTDKTFVVSVRVNGTYFGIVAKTKTGFTDYNPKAVRLFTYRGAMRVSDNIFKNHMDADSISTLVFNTKGKTSCEIMDHGRNVSSDLVAAVQ